MIQVKNLTKKFDETIVLEDISFSINESELAIVYGLNGVGKTTLIRCISGLIDVNGGNILLSPNSKSDIGIYLGHDMLIEKLTISEYLFMAGSLKGLPKFVIEKSILEFSKKLRFEEYLDKYISKISFGTKTKVLITASLIKEPKILIMDEPFIGLDLVSVKEISSILLETKNKGCTVLISSHQVDAIDDIVDKVLILKNGRILLEEFVHDLISRENSSRLIDIIISHLD